MGRNNGVQPAFPAGLTKALCRFLCVGNGVPQALQLIPELRQLLPQRPLAAPRSGRALRGARNSRKPPFHDPQHPQINGNLPVLRGNP